MTGRPAAAVVEQAVDGLLQHALLVVDDDLRRAEVQQALEAVVAVDDATVQVVQVRRREAAAVQLHHGAQVGRDHRDDIENHVRRLVLGLEERVDHLEALDGLGALLTLAVGDGVAQLFGHGRKVHGVQQVAHGLGAHAAREVVAVVEAHLAIQGLVRHELLRLDFMKASKAS